MRLDTPICDFGWKAPAFTLSDPDGVRHSLDELMGERGLLVAFICNHCPYVKAVIDRLVADAATLKTDGINSVAIMPNDYASYPEDSPPLMRDFAARHGFGFPYLVDETQQVARTWGAVCTPDFFGLNAEGALQYRGRLDDAARTDVSHRTAELLMAMQQVARTGTGPADQIASMGCSIKWSQTDNGGVWK
jgi:peroxiredoxin